MFVQIHIVVSGVVQGVSYRYYTEKKAKKLNLIGSVRNLENGNVEIYAQGADDPLQELIKWCWQGSPMSKVSNIVINEVHNQKEFHSFNTIY